MTNSISPLFSPLFSVTLDDWITGLGEKALIAWLRFHSWKNGQASQHEPFLLPLSLNKIIQRLKMGKATFYKKVLQPLLDYGLIQLQPAPDHDRELHLLVFAFPEQDPPHWVNPSPTMHPSYDRQTEESIPGPVKDTSKEDVISPECEPVMTATPQPCSESMDLPHVQLTSSHSPETLSTSNHSGFHPPRPPKVNQDPFSYSIDSLPMEIQQTIMKDPRLIERKDSIIQTYFECREHPSYSDAVFQQKMVSCVAYPHDKHRFGAYLRKALLNEWNKTPSSPAQKSPPAPYQDCPKDVPEWVFQQQERQKKNVLFPNQGLDPDQQAEINRLLKELGEI